MTEITATEQSATDVEATETEQGATETTPAAAPTVFVPAEPVTPEERIASLECDVAFLTGYLRVALGLDVTPPSLRYAAQREEAGIPTTAKMRDLIVHTAILSGSSQHWSDTRKAEVVKAERDAAWEARLAEYRAEADAKAAETVDAVVLDPQLARMNEAARDLKEGLDKLRNSRAVRLWKRTRRLRRALREIAVCLFAGLVGTLVFLGLNGVIWATAQWLQTR